MRRWRNDSAIQRRTFQRRFLRIGVLVDADDGIAAVLDGFDSLRRRGRNGLLRETRLQGRLHAAQFFDFLKERPGAVGQFGGHHFDIPRTARRINHLCQLAFLLQNELGVARDALAEIVRRADDLVERADLHAVAPAQNAGQGFDGGAQHVVVRI